MGKTIAQKIIAEHLISGEMVKGSEIGLRIDQTLTQDATGTMAYLEFESMGIPRVRTERSVAYIDHNTLQSGFMNADDHKYIQTVAAKHGIWYSRPGNGICHQVHYERFGIPGKTLIGSDSHTPTGGGIGMLAIGAGGMDVAVAMGGGAYYIPMPGMIKVELTGKLQPGVSAKDVILEVLRQLSVKGGVGYIVEYAGPGVAELSVPERCTITNMGAELGATTSIFPSDERTWDFLEAQGRGKDWKALSSDEDAEYDKLISVDMSALRPLAACPHSPDNVKPVSELGGIRVDQVCIGSCTNSSLTDMLKVASMLKGRRIADNVSLSVSPGSRQVFSMMAECGALTDLIDAGARILECACGPCIGMGFSPGSGGVSLRTFNRNFLGRSGTKDGQVYLVSPETAAASALTGVFTDPSASGRSSDLRTAGASDRGSDVRIPAPNINIYDVPDRFRINDSGIIEPLDEEAAEAAEVVKGPNIKPFPETHPLADRIETNVLLKVGDNITTDHIMPAGSRILPYRSNIPHLSQYCFEVVDPGFAERARAAGSGIIVGGQNYGQGSSREHAALVPLALGIKAVVAISFARIHAANLVNAGILPLVFENAEDYKKVRQGDRIEISSVHTGLKEDRLIMKVTAAPGDGDSSEDAGISGNIIEIPLTMQLAERQKEILLAGGLLKHTVSKEL
ncbi:MAG: aconitate hydratase [Mogibacterium sp.]|nr:aconitate hydratase [Mogibacterium sp.]